MGILPGGCVVDSVPGVPFGYIAIVVLVIASSFIALAWKLQKTFFRKFDKWYDRERI